MLDAANGSGDRRWAPEILRATGAAVEVIHAEPDGININVRLRGDRSGLARRGRRRASGADVGFALDGDADRLIAVDADRPGSSTATTSWASSRSTGWVAGALPGGVVVSVLSNGGLQAVVEAAGGQVVRTPVGDKYILEGMQVSGARLGGEKSGHVIDLDHTTSGDGIVTASRSCG